LFHLLIFLIGEKTWLYVIVNNVYLG